jgi:maltooligosyltrehalose trehalohydrolase
MEATSLPPYRLPIGAELDPGGGVRFRVWAPGHDRVDLELEDQAKRWSVQLTPEPDGHHSVIATEARAGTRYRYRVDGAGPFPDPASRFQPDGPHGSSQVIDPTTFTWTDSAWRGVPGERRVLYEMHVGTFTREGTWRAAIPHLQELAQLGVTLIEMMPIADFPGRFGWGYDGVDLFAPTRLYGAPDDLRAFVDHAHTHGIGVILDVVYNHFGPDGNYLKEFSPHYFTDRYWNDWGEPINFDGEQSAGVREFFIANAGYWIDEFHFDGLRYDATQQIFDSSPEHILAAITRQAHACAKQREIFTVAENEPQDVRLVTSPEDGGYGIDALWNDDFHHTVRVALTGHDEAYLCNYHGSAQEIISALKYGFLYQGQYYPWQKQRRGTPALHLPASTFVLFIENHDQVANSAHGARLYALTSPAQWRAAVAILLLAPGTPMLFQGQEFASSHNFLYFADHKPELAKMVRQGRLKFLEQFPTMATPDVQHTLADPSDPQTFASCKLDDVERSENVWARSLHHDLLKLRRDDPAFSAQHRTGFDGAVLGDDCFVLRYAVRSGDDRIVIVNLGGDVDMAAAPEPLLAPPGGTMWQTIWSSENPRYGGAGTARIEDEDGWHIPGRTTAVLAPVVLSREEKQ